MSSVLPPSDDFPWFTYLNQLLPYRMKQGYAGKWFLFTSALTAQVIAQYAYDSVVFRHVKHPNSPNDVLNEIGAEYGIIRAANESDDDFRQRIINRWNVLPYYGQESQLTATLNGTGYGTFAIVFDLNGTVYDIPAPKSGNPIPAYPASTDHPSQFSVFLKLNSIQGSGTESDLVTDEQLRTIRTFIKLMKPVDWVCREIVIVYNPGNIACFNDGSTYYDNLAVYEDADNLGSFQFERHRGN